MTDRQLINLAEQASRNAYVPYSHFAVGAALECRDGTVFTGCNIENAALGSTICAERTAACKAVSEGRRDFVRIAVYGDGEHYCYPAARAGSFGRVRARYGGAVRHGRRPLCQQPLERAHALYL